MLKRLFVSFVVWLSFTLGVYAQAPSVARMGISPTNPQYLQALDNTGTWVPLGYVNPTLHAFFSPPYVYNVQSFGVQCNGSGDDASNLNGLFNIITANSEVSFPARAICAYKSPLVLPILNNITIEGNGAELLYTGPTTTGNLVQWGNASDGCQMNDNRLQHFYFDSTTTMSSGYALRMIAHCRLMMDDIRFGDPNATEHLYNGLEVQGGCGPCVVNGIRGSVQNIAEAVHGGATTQLSDFFSYHNAFDHNNIGILIGGFCGGCQWDDTDTVNNRVSNVKIDQSLSSYGNPQIRFGPLFASDGGPPIGIDVEDLGVSSAADGGLPLLTAATEAFSQGQTTVTVGACPLSMLGTWFAFDRSLTPPQSIGTVSCTGGVLTISGGAAIASASSGDTLYLSGGVGPGKHGSQLFFEGSWISTNPGICLYIAPNVNKEIHVMGARIENCPTVGIQNNSDQIRMYINGGAYAQDGIALQNTAPGAHIEIQSRPSMYGGGTESGLAPSIVSGCGGSGSSIAASMDDYAFAINWGSTSGTSCQIAFQFAHDNTPADRMVGSNANDGAGYVNGTMATGVILNFPNSVTNGTILSAHMSGIGF